MGNWLGCTETCSTGFIIPFIFAFDNSLLLMGTPVMIVIAVVTAVIGCMILSVAVSRMANT